MKITKSMAAVVAAATLAGPAAAVAATHSHGSTQAGLAPGQVCKSIKQSEVTALKKLKGNDKKVARAEFKASYKACIQAAVKARQQANQSGSTTTQPTETQPTTTQPSQG